jgi:hypothetical protein
MSMASFSSYNIYLTPIRWSQQVRRFPKIKVEGRHLTVTCTTSANSDLLLTDGYRLSDFKIELAISPGELPVEERERLSEQAIGGIWWIADQAFVHGWLYLSADDYAAVWDQVRDGRYADCQISLGVGPVEYTEKSEFAWSRNPVCIETADVYFGREVTPRNPAESTAEKKGDELGEVLGNRSFCYSGDGFILPTMEWRFL